MTTAADVSTGSALGFVRLMSDGEALTEARFIEDADPTLDNGTQDALLIEACRQFRAYFAGQLTSFDLPLAPAGTEFQHRVWAELRTVPYGTTTSYGALAARLGLPPGAARAVGLANGANPIAIAIPCHRVIGSNGKLIGYAAGLHRKRMLLDFESPDAQSTLFD